MRVLGTAAALVLLAASAGPTGAARAQSGGSDGPHINMLADLPSKTPEEKEAEAAKEKAYKESLKKIPDAKASSDPWGGVRADAPKDAPKAPAKSVTSAAKTKTKTGSNPN